MGRYLLLALLTATLGICASYSLADNPPATSTPAPAAATATHAMASTAAAPASTSPQPAAAQATNTAEAKPAVAAPTATTAESEPAAPAGGANLSAPTSSGPSMPVRGMSMANVEHIFGAPQEKIPAVPDPGTKLHPPITRWVYPEYVVYFEYNYVVHTVLKDHPFTNTNSGGA